MAVEIDARDVAELIRELDAEPDPLVRMGMYYAAVILGLVVLED